MDKRKNKEKHLFSTLIKCKECGRSFKRISRTYKTTHVRWVCASHNENNSCPNAVTLPENDLIKTLDEYFVKLLKNKDDILNYIRKELNMTYAQSLDISSQIDQLKKQRGEYMNMYINDLISRQEVNHKVSGMMPEIQELETSLKATQNHLDRYTSLNKTAQDIFSQIENMVSIRNLTNEQLKYIIQKIIVDRNGNVDIYLTLIEDLKSDQRNSVISNS